MPKKIQYILVKLECKVPKAKFKEFSVHLSSIVKLLEGNGMAKKSKIQFIKNH